MVNRELPNIHKDDVVMIKLNSASVAFPALVNAPPDVAGRIDVHHLLEGRDMVFTIGPDMEITVVDRV